jgi:hypothetical protein
MRAKSMTFLQRTGIGLMMVLVAACGSSRARFAPLDVDGRHLRDRDGRAVILRGVNARIEGVFDIVLDGGRTPLYELQPFEAEDARRMAELGFNVLRLPIQWSGVEPQPGAYDDAYLDRVARVVALCKAEGILVLVDLHQDAYSKEIGEDGAPLWAIQPPPDRILEGPLTDLAARRISTQVQRAFIGFFTENRDELQEKFARMAARVAERFRDDDGVLGYEIFNEPQATDDELPAFHAKVARAIRAVDARHLIAFEPSAFRNFADSSPIADKPWAALTGDAGGLYAPHVYSAVFNNDPRLASGEYAALLDGSIASARREADSWGTPLFVGEFGAGPDSVGLGWLDRAYAGFDAHLASAALWLWKERAQGSWGLHEWDAAAGVWRERPGMIATVSRPYAQAIGGDPESMRWDGTALTVAFTTTGAPARHRLFFPSLGAATCGGAATTPRPLGRDVYEIDCARSPLVISR